MTIVAVAADADRRRVYCGAFVQLQAKCGRTDIFEATVEVLGGSMISHRRHETSGGQILQSVNTGSVMLLGG